MLDKLFREGDYSSVDWRYPDWEHWFLPLSLHPDGGIQKREQVSLQSTDDGGVDDYRVLSFSLLVGVVDVESLRVSYVNLEFADLSRPIEIVDYVVLVVQDPIVVALRDKVEKERLLLNQGHFDEEVLVLLEEGPCSIVDRDVLSVNLTNLLVDSLMDLSPDLDCFVQVLEIDVEVGHQEFPESEGEE